MREERCDKAKLSKVISYRKETIYEDIEEIVNLEKDIRDGIKRYPRDNEKIIYDTKKGIYIDIRSSLSAMYSLGLDCSTMEELYLLGIKYVTDISNDLAYFNILRYVSLGMLLGIDKTKLQTLITKLDADKFDDVLFDYIVNAYGIKRTYQSSEVAYPNPYKLLIDIVEAAKTDREKASELLKEYTEKKWIEGHADCGWKNFHKKPDYTGLWSYDAGVVSKILKLDDSELMTSIHYPYDLVHYKEELKMISDGVIEETLSRTEEEIYMYGIKENPEIEKVIPVQFHKVINEVINDYNNLDDKSMWDKYLLRDIWFTVEEYIKEKKQGLLGFIIINVLVEQRYILQIDGKEDIGDYIESIPNFWGTDEVKVISFDLKNDQFYLAKVPQSASDIKIYEIAANTL